MSLRKVNGLCARTAGLGTAVIAGLMALTTLSAERRSIGERIQFSNPNDAADLPKDRLDDKAFPRRFEFLDRGNSISGVVEPLVMPAPNSLPSLPRDPRLFDLFQEKLDQKKNWIYGRPADLTRTKSLNQMFGVRETDAGGRPPKPRNALENYFEERSSRPAPKKESSDWTKQRRHQPYDSNFEQDRSVMSGLDPRVTNPFDRNRAAAAGFSFSGELFRAAPGQAQVLRDVGSLGGNSFNRAREDQLRSDNFRKLLAAPGNNPLVLGFDPVQLQIDGTRQELNPITPKLPADLSIKSPLDALGGINAGSANSSFGALTDPGAKILGASSLSPVISPPPESSNFKPQPAVLEFPKRKF